MQRIVHVASAAFLLFLMTGPVLMIGPARADAALDALKTAQQRWEEAFLTRDGAKVAETVFTEDAALLPPGEPIVEGREAIGAYWQGGFDAGARDLKLGITSADLVGEDTLIETGTWRVTVPTEEGGEAEVRGKALVVWKKGADGLWRMARDMWSADE